MCVLLHSSRFSVEPACAVVRAGLLEGRRRQQQTVMDKPNRHNWCMSGASGEGFSCSCDRNVSTRRSDSSLLRAQISLSTKNCLKRPNWSQEREHVSEKSRQKTFPALQQCSDWIQLKQKQKTLLFEFPARISMWNPCQMFQRHTKNTQGVKKRPQTVYFLFFFLVSGISAVWWGANIVQDENESTTKKWKMFFKDFFSFNKASNIGL